MFKACYDRDGDNMKNNLKVFLIALIGGIGVIYFINYKFPTVITKALAPEATIFYVGAYNDLETALEKQNNYNSAVIYNKEGVYKVVIGIYNKEEVIALMESYFLDKDLTFKESQIKIDNTLLKNMENYELLIKNSNQEYYEGLNNSLLNLFKEYLN